MVDANLSVSSRRLAAIMFTDIVGYTSLMGKDSKKALELVRRSLEIQKPLVKKYDGNWLKEIGDGTMAQFNTAQDAVNCALEIQRNARADFDGKIRIGIHSGDITIENDDIYGDGVNVASRLESIADPGGIYVSDAIMKAMRGHGDIESVDLGEKKLKNVDYGVRTYAIQGVGLPIPGDHANRKSQGPTGSSGIATILKWSGWVLALIIILTAVFYLSNSTDLNNPSLTIKRFNIIFPKEAPIALIGEAEGQWSYASLCLSPDGQHLVYAGWNNGRSLLFMRDIASTKVIPIEGTEGAYGPFFSPDGKWIAYSTARKLKKIMLPNGSPIDIVTANIQSGAVWTSNDEIIYSNDSAIYKISSRGGTAEKILGRISYDIVGGYTTGVGITSDERHILFSNIDGDIFTANLESKETKLIYPRGGGAPKYVPSGHLIFSRSNSLFAVPFDETTLTVTGPENQVISDLRTERSGAQITFANDGMAIHIPGEYYQKSAFMWIYKDPESWVMTKTGLDADNYGSFDVSPDGNLLAISMLPAQDHIKIYDFRTGQLTRIKVAGSERLYSPVWGPDNESVIFGSRTDDGWHLYRKNINEVRDAWKLNYVLSDTHLDVNDEQAWPYSWSDDGKFITTLSMVMEVVNPDEFKSHTIIDGGHHMAISPNGRFIVYASDISGSEEIYVQPFPPSGEKWQISADGGTDPIWSMDGQRIYYHNNLKVYKVDVKSFDPFQPGSPTVFYPGDFMNAVSRSLSAGSDDRVLMLEPATGSQITQVAVVTLNWFEELKQLAPPQD